MFTCKTFAIAVLSMLALACSVAHAAGHNESCSHADGTCAKPERVTTGLLPGAFIGSDEALLGQIDKDWTSEAMKPAAFPSFLPSGLGAGSSINLPQPNLKIVDKNDRAPLAMTGSAVDGLGLF